jgi:hypothetical protein
MTASVAVAACVAPAATAAFSSPNRHTDGLRAAIPTTRNIRIPAPTITATVFHWMRAPATVLDSGVRPTTANMRTLIMRPSMCGAVRSCSQVMNWMTT